MYQNTFISLHLDIFKYCINISIIDTINMWWPRPPLYFFCVCINNAQYKPG